jgi:hypothetical protein
MMTCVFVHDSSAECKHLNARGAYLLTLTNPSLKPLVHNLQSVFSDLDLREVVVHHSGFRSVEKIGLDDDLREDMQLLAIKSCVNVTKYYLFGQWRTWSFK